MGHHGTIFYQKMESQCGKSDLPENAMTASPLIGREYKVDLECSRDHWLPDDILFGLIRSADND